MTDQPDTKTLRYGWTTGACATAAAKAACMALMQQHFPDKVSITLPGGQQPLFTVALAEQGLGWARAGIIKDAGDDPDITHGAMIITTLSHGAAGSGVSFRAGPGVGTITKPGLPLPPGEPAINPVPRQLICRELEQIAKAVGSAADFQVEISVPNGEKLALGTWNPRLGIVGGLSILGTTGVVVPYSCSAWIHSIQRGIDVARATGLTHVLACTGNSSEKAALALTGLPPEAVIDMGDFIGGMLKYLRHHPLPQLTIAGGFAKLCKFAAGALDVHSKRSQVDKAWLAQHLALLGALPEVVAKAADANSALEILQLSQSHALPLGDHMAQLAAQMAQRTLSPAQIGVTVLAFDRRGLLVGRSQ